MKILKTAPGLDPHSYLAARLGDGFEVAEADFSRPLAGQVAETEVFITRDVAITAAVIDAAPRLKLIQRYGHHVANVDTDHAKARGIPVARIPSDVSGSNLVVAEHAFFLMMALAKRYPESRRVLEASRLGRPETGLLTGKTLGLVGIGGTGAELARLAKAFGMTVVAVKRDITKLDGAEPYLDGVAGIGELDALLGRSDYVSLHLPLLPATVGFVGAPFFAAMRPHAYFINIARGEIVEKAALLDALRAGTIAGAGIDVFWNEGSFDAADILAAPNLVATPHIAGASIDCLHRLADAGADNIRRVAAGAEPLYRVA